MRKTAKELREIAMIENKSNDILNLMLNKSEHFAQKGEMKATFELHGEGFNNNEKWKTTYSLYHKLTMLGYDVTVNGRHGIPIITVSWGD